MKNLLNQFKDQLGWQGMVGIALLGLAGAFQMAALEHLQQEVAVMDGHLVGAHAKSSVQSKNYNLDNRQKELGMFFSSLPAEKDVTDILASIYSIAEAGGVVLKQAEYHPDEGDNKSRVEYGMVFPVQGEYAKIRYFVARVLADHHAITLDQIRFERGSISDPTLKADIRMTLFLEPSR